MHRRRAKRRSLLVTGVLMVGLLAAGVAEAQPTGGSFGSGSNATPLMIVVDEGRTATVQLRVAMPIASGETGTPFEIGMMGYDPNEFSVYGPGVDISGMTLTVTMRENQRSASITVASVVDGDGTNEFLTLTIADGDAADSGKSVAVVTVRDAQRAAVEFKEEAATILEGAKGSIKVNGLTPPYTYNEEGAWVHVEEVSSDGNPMLQLTSTDSNARYDADGRLRVPLADDVEAEATFSALALQDMDGRNAETMLRLTMPGDGVRLGTMVEMTISIVDDDEDDGTTPTPTPALPLFGAFALGSGLLAVGRRRLRQPHLSAHAVGR
jgi:hypothetical protein